MVRAPHPVRGLGEVSRRRAGRGERGVGGDQAAIGRSRVPLDAPGRHIDHALVARTHRGPPCTVSPDRRLERVSVDARQVKLAEVRREDRQVVEHEGAVMARGCPSATARTAARARAACRTRRRSHGVTPSVDSRSGREYQPRPRWTKRSSFTSAVRSRFVSPAASASPVRPPARAGRPPPPRSPRPRHAVQRLGNAVGGPPPVGRRPGLCDEPSAPCGHRRARSSRHAYVRTCPHGDEGPEPTAAQCPSASERNSAKRAGWAWTRSSRPPLDSARSRARASPRPVLPAPLLTDRSKMCGAMAAGTPSPWSLTSTTTDGPDCGGRARRRCRDRATREFSSSVREHLRQRDRRRPDEQAALAVHAHDCAGPARRPAATRAAGRR